MLTRLLTTVAVVALCVVYVLPGHPSPGPRVFLDVASHVAFFAALGGASVLVFRRYWVLGVLAVLALLLEVVQWRVVGFPHLEWRDVVSNEGGVVVAWCAWMVVRRFTRGGGVVHHGGGR